MAQKKLPAWPEAKRAMIEPTHPELSLRRQCELLGLARATYYYQPAGESELNLRLMRLLDEQYLKTPFYGWPKLTAWLQQQGFAINHKRVQRLLQLMGLQAIYPKPKTTVAGQGAQDLSVPAARLGHHTPESSLECGYYILAAATRLHVPGGGHRLVQSLRARLAAVEHARRPILSRGAQPGVARRSA